MKKKFIFTIVAACLFLACSQDENVFVTKNSPAGDYHITIEQAKRNAIDFVSRLNTNTRSTKTPMDISNVQAISIPKGTTRSESDSTQMDTLLYIINFADSCGFIVAGTDTREKSIYAYIEEGNFSLDSLNSLDSGFGAFIYALLESKTYDSQHAPAEIPDPGEGGGSGWGGNIPDKFEVMYPLLVTKWGQGSPYNTYAPNGVTGCVPTAMAQICSFLEKPYRVEWNYNGTIGAADLNWGQIKSECQNWGYPTTDESKDQVAHLMRALGLAFHADYADGETGADSDDAVEAMRNMWLDVDELNDYDISNVINDLKAGNKILYMRGNARYYLVGFVFRKYVDGHAWVVDGYIDEVKNNIESIYIHCNWGWHGYRNGYFLSDVLNAEESPVFNDNGTRSENFRYRLETATFTK